ncbi:Uncharacterised protein [Bordetella pertussis]|nr:Uncharacterised protein [Bordetella pertussis]CFO76479.1 Uncharacterised protein [Bordetella pertussis]CFU86423.1 Uncharacterised protein [Bordetella pertussis]CFV98756.1 Uncharacterised protein [Bordetella pertussis]CPI28816.1 Uncharacterised protein [Bordetella pertussis]
MALDVKPVLQAQGAELVFGQLAVEKAPRLVRELFHTLFDQLLVDWIVHVHVLLPFGVRCMARASPEDAILD